MDDWMRIVCAVFNVSLLRVGQWFFQVEIPKVRAFAYNLRECPLLQTLFIQPSDGRKYFLNSNAFSAGDQPQDFRGCSRESPTLEPQRCVFETCGR